MRVFFIGEKGINFQVSFLYAHLIQTISGLIFKGK